MSNVSEKEHLPNLESTMPSQVDRRGQVGRVLAAERTNEKQAAADVALEQGKSVIVIGPAGAGKTRFLICSPGGLLLVASQVFKI